MYAGENKMIMKLY